MCEESAYHEAGHAFRAVQLGAAVRSVTIAPEWDDGPARYADVSIDFSGMQCSPRQLAEASVSVALAGPAAEMIYRGEPYHPGFVAEWAADWRTAWEIAEQLQPEERNRLAYLEQVTVNLHQLLRRENWWAAIAAIADDLLAHETLEGEQVDEIVGYWLRNG